MIIISALLILRASGPAPNVAWPAPARGMSAKKEGLMLTIIAGSRSITDYEIVKEAIEKSGFDISCIVSGGAKDVDSLGEQDARENGVELKQFLANGEDFSNPCIYRSTSMAS